MEAKISLQFHAVWSEPSLFKHSKYVNRELEDLMVLKHSPDLLNVKIGQDQLQLIMKHILFYGGCATFVK